MASVASEESAPSFYPDWAKEAKKVLIAGMICCGVLIIICFFIFIPLAVTMYQTDGNCFLYADTYGYGAGSICDYCIAMAVIFLILCAFRLLLLVYKFFELPEQPIVDKVSKWYSLYGVHLVVLAIDVLLLILLLVMACIVSVGKAHLCSSLFGSQSKCSEHDGVILPTERVNMSFYTALTVSEAASWIGFLLWFAIVIWESYVAWKKDTLKPFISKFRREEARSSTV